MAVDNHVRNPIEWGWEQLRLAGHAVGAAGRSARGARDAQEGALPVRKIGIDDLRDALARGISDFGAYRTDVLFICLIYPAAGLVLWRLAFGYEMLPLLFPLVSGFALIGPVAAVGLYEMSRRREQGLDTTWADAFGVVRSSNFGAIVALGLVLIAIFTVWLFTAYMIYAALFGPYAPNSIEAFARDVFTTTAGWTMIAVGMGVGFVFALLVLTISVVSFPLLLDRDVGVFTAVTTSVRAVAENPRTMTVWGLIVAGGLVLGSIPLLLGLIFVMPVLGHATWHLYRKVVPR